MPQEAMYQQLSDSLGVGDSQILPRIFEMLADEDEAKILLAASPPATVAELAEKTGLPEQDVEKRMVPLFTKGLVFKSKKPDGIRYYRVRSLLQFHDATVLAPDVPQEVRGVWKEYHEKEFATHHKRMESALSNSRLRVVPVNVALEFDNRIGAFEDVREIVEQADTLAVTACACRVIDGSCGKPLDVCIQINRAAEYAIERGSGKEISKEEAIEKLKFAEEEGLVHTVGNTRGLGHIICNCCEDCCINWPGPRTSAVNYCAPSRFAAVVDEDDCTGCETCLDRCYFEAIEMDDGIAKVVEENCMGCGLCAVTCPTDAVSMKEVRNEAFVPN
jgi:Pyruvate/2-oxoacid:ferredoxin oxidoreductase delta subunit